MVPSSQVTKDGLAAETDLTIKNNFILQNWHIITTTSHYDKLTLYRQYLEL